MIDVITQNDNPFFKATDLYDELELNFFRYSDWVKRHITNHPKKLPEKGVDYIILPKSTARQDGPGVRRNDRILISPSFARELCMISRSEKAKAIRDWIKDTF